MISGEKMGQTRRIWREGGIEADEGREREKRVRSAWTSGLVGSDAEG